MISVLSLLSPYNVAEAAPGGMVQVQGSLTDADGLPIDEREGSSKWPPFDRNAVYPTGAVPALAWWAGRRRDEVPYCRWESSTSGIVG